MVLLRARAHLARVGCILGHKPIEVAGEAVERVGVTVEAGLPRRTGVSDAVVAAPRVHSWGHAPRAARQQRAWRGRAA